MIPRPYTADCVLCALAADTWRELVTVRRSIAAGTDDLPDACRALRRLAELSLTFDQLNDHAHGAEL